MYCPIRTTLNPAHTTQQLRVLTYPGVRVVVSVSMVTLVVVVGLVVVLSSAVCLYSGVCGGGRAWQERVAMYVRSEYLPQAIKLSLYCYKCNMFAHADAHCGYMHSIIQCAL